MDTTFWWYYSCICFFAAAAVVFNLFTKQCWCFFLVQHVHLNFKKVMTKILQFSKFLKRTYRCRTFLEIWKLTIHLGPVVQSKITLIKAKRPAQMISYSCSFHLSLSITNSIEILFLDWNKCFSLKYIDTNTIFAGETISLAILRVSINPLWTAVSC